MEEAGFGSRYWPSVLILGVGLSVVTYAYMTLRMGSISRPGPGAFPVVLGLFMTATGVVSTLTIAWKSRAGELPACVVQPDGEEQERFDLKVALFVILALGVFALFVENLGLAPAIFAQIFITASIGNKLSWTSRLLLAAGAAAAATLMFAVLLSVPVPIVNWPFGR